jgi:hypothetical protein
MNFFKNIYKNGLYIYNNYINYINYYVNNEYFKTINNYLVFPSFIYFNFMNKYIFLKYIFNIYFTYNLYKYRYYYINSIIDIYLIIKFKINNIFPKNKSFILKKILLYTNLKENHDVTKYFYKNEKNIREINKLLIVNIYSLLNIQFDNDKDIRLKIYFKYNDIDYIIYFPYHNFNIYENNSNNYYIPYPPYSDIIINNFRNDIIHPFYTTQNKKKYLYSLFNIESKDILSIEINNNNYNNLIKYFNMIKTPFNDYGILYNVPIKLIWILVENNINIHTFYNFYLKFESLYINEETYELNEHTIEMSNNDINEYIISNRMKEIIIIKKKEDSKKIL